MVDIKDNDLYSELAKRHFNLTCGVSEVQSKHPEARAYIKRLAYTFLYSNATSVRLWSKNE